MFQICYDNRPPFISRHAAPVEKWSAAALRRMRGAGAGFGLAVACDRDRLCLDITLGRGGSATLLPAAKRRNRSQPMTPAIYATSMQPTGIVVPSPSLLKNGSATWLGLALLAFAPVTFAQAAPIAPDLSGTTDASIREVLRVVARHQMRPLKDGEYPVVDSVAAAGAARPPEGISWNYPWGVTLYGVLRSTDATGDREALDFVLEHNRIVARYYAWLSATHERTGESAEWEAFIHDNSKVRTGGLLRLGHLDSCGAMGVQTLEGILRHPDQMIPEQKAVVARIASWIADQQARLPDGTFWRPDSTDLHKIWPPGTIWIDDLYMGCPYLVRWSQLTGENKYLHDAAQQVLNMAARLQDTDGVWFHAYSETKKTPSPFKWGRANGWAMVAAAEILSALPDNHPDRPALLDVLRRQIEGVKKLQPASGVWPQILDHPELWQEVS